MGALSFDVAPGAHWGDLSGQLDDALSRGLENGDEGIALTAPPLLTIGVNTRCPLSGIRVASLRDIARAPLYAAVVICSCVETGEVLTCAAVPPPEGFPYEDPDDPGSGLAGQSFGLDLFDTPGIPQKQATWVVRVALHGQVSNGVTIRIEPPRSNRYVDPAAEELIRELMRKPILRPLNPRPSLGPGLPVYEPLPETPKLPDAPGIEMKVKRAQLLDPKAQLLIHGSFRAAILPRDVRPPPSADAAKLRGPRATAVVPMALVALSSAKVGASIVQLVVPSYQPLEGEGELRTGTGAFTFDYFQLTQIPEQAQTLFLYAFAGALMSPVAPCALVDPSLVNLG